MTDGVGNTTQNHMDGTSTMRPMNDAELFEQLKTAYLGIKTIRTPSRENSIVLTKLEEAMMWFNKDRTLRGELTPTETHVGY